MSAATSPGTGLAYGLQRVCAAWGFARSSFYAMKSRQQATAERPPAKRRGPKPSISDEALLVAIEADLEASPWEGEGHRKVWARLRVCRGIRVSRKRVLRVMRENNLLSPHRCRRRGGNPHVGEIITHAPNLMWGTDEFYRLRMRAQRGKEGCSLLSLANWLFDVSSDYGWSVPRALAWWFGHFTVMALLIFSGASTVPAKPECGPVFWDSFLTSFANAHTLLGLASEGGYLHAARVCLVAGNHTGWILIAAGVLEAVFGPILLFMVLLTLRNRFRLR